MHLPATDTIHVAVITGIKWGDVVVNGERHRYPIAISDDFSDMGINMSDIDSIEVEEHLSEGEK